MSWMNQNRGVAGTNDIAACRTMPSSKAPPLSASRAWSRSDVGVAAVEGDMGGLIPAGEKLLPDSLPNRGAALLPNPKIG
ncbi:hypothetical protein BDS110ZK25_24130 [Bradyrhizobium diazoefficiens]|uniref:Uncharacterized protein n=1 Tax=Bradyrhizobium diazoefficiens TaxID=1355477 RepID=A0A810BKD0_9BRAD|nr:hypothetical protein F07S3_76680 [Bradyrhizobium diazoefficiens]BCA06872.1 hypothetical protein H12S4_77760 [Bradyrhizobium diazoefficiens]BCA15519.1 hypothetical protein BDHF08_73660 [Bradyrhizobium diazoefficiens]BCA24223.1 hypothetical protein BDHH15_74380 [Bradyrhizobium diazoefficiens]BCE24933.1 hypothetical protein XF1B_76140 [Bradyrhizobium diazoefficiens]